jgi:hypothetical protein
VVWMLSRMAHKSGEPIKAVGTPERENISTFEGRVRSAE